MSNIIDPISVKTTRTNEEKEVIQSYSNIDVKVEYFWNDRGNLIHWSHNVGQPTEWTEVDAQIIKYSFTEKLFEESYDFETMQLAINNEIIAGEVESYSAQLDTDSNKITLSCRITVGWG